MNLNVHPRFITLGRALLYFFLPLIVLAITSLPGFASYTLHLGFVILLVAIGLGFARTEKIQTIKTTIHSLVILLLVGGTGWFLSPFFFLLYLLPIYLGFLYTPTVAFGFLAALIVIFASSVGEVDIAFDTMTLLSLLLVVPLVIYLRRRYLILRQSKKDILILQHDGGIKDLDTIGKLLANRVTSLGVNVRQPLTFVKQAAALLLEGKLDQSETQQMTERIRTTAEETLDMIRSFEGETSANEVLRNKNVPKKEDQDTSFAQADEFMKSMKNSGEITPPNKR